MCLCEGYTNIHVLTETLTTNQEVRKAERLLKQHQAHADRPIQTIKHIEISSPVVTLLTSHLFEPEQLRGLHLW